MYGIRHSEYPVHFQRAFRHGKTRNLSQNYKRRSWSLSFPLTNFFNVYLLLPFQTPIPRKSVDIAETTELAGFLSVRQVGNDLQHTVDMFTNPSVLVLCQCRLSAGAGVLYIHTICTNSLIAIPAQVVPSVILIHWARFSVGQREACRKMFN
ncbi:hypothetical protein GE21DRAFT_1053709 [Neurospora crassa]|nr:hypothetical protein GE21DRAFT_1053709 [Neurospora crassa]